MDRSLLLEMFEIFLMAVIIIESVLISISVHILLGFYSVRTEAVVLPNPVLFSGLLSGLVVGVGVSYLSVDYLAPVIEERFMRTDG